MVCKDHSTINAQWNEDHNGLGNSYLKISNWLKLTFYDINDIKLPNHAYVMRSSKWWLWEDCNLQK